jgi:hypothetical protein
MIQQLGTLKRKDAREIWRHEAHEFTPWLKENIALLSAALGMDLDLVETEVRVGPFAADLVAKDVSNDRLVVIENQLESTDHGHLGQLLTYGAGSEAHVFVWISPEFREEHRAALDWLNEHSDPDSLFFGVVIELLVVDDSRPAPNFRLVSFPNEVSKAGTGARSTRSPRMDAYAAFYSSVLSLFKERFPGETSVSKASGDSWLSMSIGRAGFSTGWAFTADRRFRVELYIDLGDVTLNEALFDQLHLHRGDIETAMSQGLDWDRLDGKRGCRISLYYPASPVSVMDGETSLTQLKEWAVTEMKRLRDTMKLVVQQLNVDGVTQSV